MPEREYHREPQPLYAAAGARGTPAPLPLAHRRRYLARVSYPDALFDLFMHPLEAVALRARRRCRIARAAGDVLEVGAGTGANLAYYDPRRVGSLTLTDLSIGERIQERAAAFRRSGLLDGALRLADADALDLPFASASFDTVAFTLVFCSVADQPAAFAELRRVLRPGGRLVFIEHVRPRGGAGRLTDALNPVWRAATRECNINRDTVTAIRGAGFLIDDLQAGGGGFLVDGAARRG